MMRRFCFHRLAKSLLSLWSRLAIGRIEYPGQQVFLRDGIVGRGRVHTMGRELVALDGFLQRNSRVGLVILLAQFPLA